MISQDTSPVPSSTELADAASRHNRRSGVIKREENPRARIRSLNPPIYPRNCIKSADPILEHSEQAPRPRYLEGGLVGISRIARDAPLWVTTAHKG